MSYTLSQVDEAERRIRAACPGAIVNRGNYNFTLWVQTADRSRVYLVFDSDPGEHPTVIGDVDAIIRALNAH